MAREKKANAELFMFLKLAGSCLESWHNLLIRKKQRLKRLELGNSDPAFVCIYILENSILSLPPIHRSETI
jgi:hypothetical protein